MKAVIMAGGQGTRGRPYTEYFPKAMMPVGDSPLVDHIIRYVESFDFIDGVVVIADLAGLGGQIKNYYGPDAAPRIVFVQDSQSGTGGDLLHASDLLRGEPFVLWFADNLCALDLDGMYAKFRDRASAACIATRSMRAEETGFALVDDDGVVLEFVEKPVLRLPSSECLGMYILGPEVLRRVSRAAASRGGGGGGGSSDNGGSGGGINLSYDILQDLSGEGAISAFDIGEAQWVDVESPAALERNRARVEQITAEMQRRAGSWAGRPPSC